MKKLFLTFQISTFKTDKFFKKKKKKKCMAVTVILKRSPT